MCAFVCVCVYRFGWAAIAVPVRVGMGVFCEDACVYGCVCVLWCSVHVYVRKGGYVVIDSACGGVCECVLLAVTWLSGLPFGVWGWV